MIPSVDMEALFLLDEVAVVDNEFGHFHQQTRIVLEFLKAGWGRDLLEIFDEVVDAELL